MDDELICHTAGQLDAVICLYALLFKMSSQKVDLQWNKFDKSETQDLLSSFSVRLLVFWNRSTKRKSLIHF